MNKKLLIVAIVGWVYAAIMINDNIEMRKEFDATLNAQSDLFEEATKIVTEARFNQIIERFDDV